MRLRDEHKRDFKAILFALAFATLGMLLSKVAHGKAETKADGDFYYESETNRFFTNQEARFSVRPTGDSKFVDRVEVSIDGESFKEYEGNVEFESEGLHYIRFRAVDAVLNWSPIQSFRVYVDLTPPTSQPFWDGQTFQPDEDTLFINPKTTLRVVTQDSLSGVKKVLWKMGDQITTVPFNQNFPKEGNYRARYSAVDHVGNRGEWSELRFKVDGTAPSTKADLKGDVFKKGTTLFVGSGNTIALTSQDKGSGVNRIEYKINNGSVNQYFEPISVSLPNFKLTYRAIDEVGNEEKWKTYSIQQDTVPPNIVVEKKGRHIMFSGRLYARPGIEISAKASDSESGLKSILVSKNDSDFEKTNDALFKFDEPGIYKVRLRAQDLVGNYDEANPVTVVVDSQAPKSNLTATNELVERDGLMLSSIPNTLEIRSEDEGVGVEKIEFGYDGKTFSPLTKPIDLAQWQNSTKTLYYRAVDKLGNREPTRKIQIAVRTEGPKVDLFVESKNYPKVALSSLLRDPGIERKASKREYRGSNRVVTPVTVSKEKKKRARKPAKVSKKKVKKKSKKSKKKSRRKGRKKKR